MPVDTIAFYVSYAGLWTLVLFQTLVLLELLRRDPQAREFVDQVDLGGEDMLPTGTPAPRFTAEDVRTGDLLASASLNGRPLLLVFVSPTCRACHLILDELTSYRGAADARLLIVCSASVESCREYAEDFLPSSLVVADNDGSVARSFRISQTPTAVLVDKDGRIDRYGYPQAKPRLDIDGLLDSAGRHSVSEESADSFSDSVSLS